MAALALIPPHLKPHCPRTPWKISPDLEGRLKSPLVENGFWRAEVISSDPEFDFVQKLFLASKPVGYGISKITCLSNGSPKFEKRLRKINKASEKTPSNQLEGNKTALQSWKASADLFSPIEVSIPGTNPPKKKTLTSVKVLPLWDFGKRHPNQSSSICYLTTSAQYAALRHQNFLVLSWVAMPEPCPIVNCSDVEIRDGELHRTYYIPLVSQNLDDLSYISCPSNQSPEAAEFVVNSSQTLPRFQVDLAIIEPEHLFRTYTTERLHTAAATGQLSVLKGWVHEDGKRLKEKDGQGNTLWHTAIRGSQLPVLEWLHEQDPQFLTQPGDEDLTLFNFANRCGAIPQINYWIFRQKNFVIKNFPDFMAMGLDPRSGPYVEVQTSRPPLNGWEIYEEAVKNITGYAVTGAAVGGALGGAGGYLVNLKELQNEESQESAMRNIRFAAVIGAFVLGILGAFQGISVNRKMHLDRQQVHDKLPESSERAKAIIEAFVASQMADIKDLDQIMCPLSKTVMVFPTKVNCGSKPPHIFEYFSIANWLSDPANGSSCPTCRKADMQIADLELNDERGGLIIKNIQGIFVTLEALLNRLPKSPLGWGQMPHFSDTEQMAALAKKIKAGQPLLAQETGQIVEKIKSNILSDAETYALGHYLISRLQPVQDKIDKIYRMSNNYLEDLWMSCKDGDRSTLEVQSKKLKEWYSRLRLIPPGCNTLSQLYRIREKV